MTLFVCDQEQDKILAKIQFKDNKLLDGVVPDHYRHDLFRHDFENASENYKVCMIFQRGAVKHHEKIAVWVKKLAFKLNEFGEHTLDDLVREVEDEGTASRIRELLKSLGKRE